MFGVPVAGRLLRGTPRRRPARGLLSHLDAHSAPAALSLVLPQQIQAILDGGAVFDTDTGSWQGNLRDRFLFSLLAEKACGLGRY